MNKIFSIITLSLCVTAATAQQRWTLDDCVSYAVAHATTVRKAEVTAEHRRDDARLIRLSLLPTLEGAVAAQYSWGRNIDPETNTYDNVTTFNNYYQLQASLTLFDGGQTLRAFKLARLNREQSATALEKARDDKALEVMARFIDAVYAQKSIRLAEEKLGDSQALLHKTQRLFELGSKSKPDVAQVQSQVATDDYNLLHQQNEYRKAMLALCSSMNFNEGDTLELDPTFRAGTRQETDSVGMTGGDAEVRIAQMEVNKARLQWKDSRAQLLPRLSLGAGLYTSYYKNFSQHSAAYPSLGSQLNNNLGEYLSLTLSIPVFDAGSLRNLRKAKADRDAAAFDLAAARRRLHDDRMQALLDRNGYAREVEQMKAKVEADSLAWHLARRKYEEGMLSVFDLQQTTQTLLESRIKLLQMQLMLVMKQRLVDYYKGEPLWTAK